MEMPTYQAVSLLEEQGYTWLDHIYQGSVPAEEVNDTSHTVAVVTETISRPTDYANNTFKGWEMGVEVQIFYAQKFQHPLCDVEIELATVFKKEGWLISQSKAHKKDPDTGQITKVFYFKKKLILKEH
ncbi:DUF806 family protein [Lactococcus garvieae subsp. garvieae]|uniref:DUF806 family protein n=1 Tax=Lactococcus garvieae TaxID=1363 RepID=UPI0005AA7348|nr:DUF806 family protein [Lactococcus garvieae]KAA8718819.1 DUF806 family protein [Lactococcus garvieae subsp. garvieae]MDG6191140.1 DUF806 family protein [Lactococcus garvieae]PCS00293.1 hypothetical protein RU85_GL000713 [Lactococcus garvieae]QPR48978.1 DUF806 family protein [Lactococcus garvieae]